MASVLHPNLKFLGTSDRKEKDFGMSKTGVKPSSGTMTKLVVN